MWGTSSPDDKLVSDLAKATEAIKIAARRSDRLMAGKLSPCNFGLLQQYLPGPDASRCSKRRLLFEGNVRTGGPNQAINPAFPGQLGAHFGDHSEKGDSR